MPPPEPVPSVSRDVHYLAPGSADGRYPPAHRAAKITEVYELGNLPSFDMDDPPPVLTVDERGVIMHVGLVVFNPTGIHFRSAVPYDATATKPGTWHWPERVADK